MSEEQDCTSIRRQAIRMICFDLNGAMGVLGSCSDMLNSIKIDGQPYDDREISEIIKVAQDHQRRSESLFIGFIDHMKSNSVGCEAELSGIIEQIETLYQDDFKAWYSYLEQLEIQYLETHELDTKLIHLLLHHAGNLAQFLQRLRDEQTKFYG